MQTHHIHCVATYRPCLRFSILIWMNGEQQEVSTEGWPWYGIWFERITWVIWRFCLEGRKNKEYSTLNKPHKIQKGWWPMDLLSISYPSVVLRNQMLDLWLSLKLFAYWGKRHQEALRHLARVFLPKGGYPNQLIDILAWRVQCLWRST